MHRIAALSGDSGNDIDLLFGADDEKGVLVANADKQLINAWKQFLNKEVYNDGHDRIYHARNRCAAGVLEGLEHFGFL